MKAWAIFFLQKLDYILNSLLLGKNSLFIYLFNIFIGV